MERNKIYEDLTLILRRAKTVFIVFEVCFVLVVFYYWKVQILDHKKFWKLSEANRIREVVLPAPRGLIIDRHDVILADNVPSFKTSLIRENRKNWDETLAETSTLLSIEEEELKQRIEKYKSFPLFKPIIIKDKQTIEEASRIEARRLEHPELAVDVEPQRYYPFGSLAAHVVGYLQELSPEELKSDLFKEKTLGDLVGKTGLEKEYQSLLDGKSGKSIEIVDSLGRSRGHLERTDPLPGDTLRLTMDFDIQRKAKELLEGKEGTIIVMDAQTGGILALVSYPTYDPNKFISRFTPEEWVDLINSPEHPLENRAVRGAYAPGSIFKLTMALGGLDSHVIGENTAYFCGGATQIYGRPFLCWFKGGHGLISVVDSLRYSCNIYFYNLGRRMGIERIAEYARILGFGYKTGVDLPGEREGLVPDPEWKRTVRKADWYAGETISVSIGQGPLVVTPLQVAAHTALIANRGIKLAPRLVGSKVIPLSNGGKNDGKETPTKRIAREVFEIVIEGMWRAVNQEGTGRSAKVEGFDVCGKTGSTQLIGRERAEKMKRKVKTHSWFTGFAPRYNPRVVVTVLVEFGGMGGETAGPMARELFDYFRIKYD